MTETQTPNHACPDCAGTGFVPPFMDQCACPAGFLAAVDATAEAFAAEKAAATEVWGGGAEVDEAIAHIGDTTTTVSGDTVVWNGTMWEPVATTGTTAGTVEWLPPLTSVPPFLTERPPMDPDVAAALEPADPSWICDGGSEHSGSQRTCTCVADAEAATEAMIAAAEAGEPPFVTHSVWATPSPAATAAWVATPKLATDAQNGLLARLCAERDASHPVVARALTALSDGVLTSRDASKLIDAVMLVDRDPTKKPTRPNNYDGTCRDCGGVVAAKAGTIRKIDGRWVTFHHDGDCLSSEAKAALEADRITEPGLYKDDVDGTPRVFRVRKSRSTPRLYAELVCPQTDGSVEFAYNAKAMAWLRASSKLTWAEARDFGAAYGACIACGRTLSDARSLVQGYGATCAGHYGWPTVTAKQAEAIIAGASTWDDVISDLGVLTS